VYSGGEEGTSEQHEDSLVDERSLPMHSHRYAMRPIVLTLMTALAACRSSAPSPPPREKVELQPPASGGTPVADPKAVADLDTGERRIDVSGGDCAAACDAVGLMNRARIKLCSPRTSACDDAERREGDARKKVVGFCGPCP